MGVPLSVPSYSPCKGFLWLGIYFPYFTAKRLSQPLSAAEKPPPALTENGFSKGLIWLSKWRAI